MDDDRKCPIDKRIIPPEGDLLSEKRLGILREFIEQNGGDRFSLTALVSSHDALDCVLVFASMATVTISVPQRKAAPHI